MTIQGRARLALDIPVDLAREFDTDCKRRNITKTDAAITAIRNFILSDELESNYFEKQKGATHVAEVVQPQAPRAKRTFVPGAPVTTKRTSTRTKGRRTT